MERDTKILSAIAAGILAVAIGVLAYANHQGADDSSVPGVDGGRFPVNPLPGESVAAGKLAADFNLTDLGGNPISLSSLRGKVVFLNIWATWCGPCREEMPSIETLYEEFNKDPDFVMLAVSQDSGDRGSAVLSYVRRN